MDKIANIITIISGIMTIFGVTGIIGWSLSKESGQSLSQASMSIFAKAFKIALCIVSFLILLLPIQAIHILIVLSIGDGYMPASTKSLEFWWRDSDWYAYLVSYCVVVLIGVPLYALSASSIYTWSLRPFHTFWNQVRGR